MAYLIYNFLEALLEQILLAPFLHLSFTPPPPYLCISFFLPLGLFTNVHV